MKKLFTIIITGLFYTISAQETNPGAITFNGCHNLFQNVNYIFTRNDLSNGKVLFSTSPIDGVQECGGIGTCEFLIRWNFTLERWEFLADKGDGDFADPYLIFYNSGGNPAYTIPPGLNVGEWIENTAVTNGACGGNLSKDNASMTGLLQDASLSVDNVSNSKMQIFPNPVVDIIKVKGINNPKTIIIYNTLGQMIMEKPFSNEINVSHLKTGTYLLRIINNDNQNYDLKFIKK